MINFAENLQIQAMKKFLPLFFCLCTIISLNAQTIAEIQGTSQDSPYDGQEVSTSGIVTATHGDGYYLQDGTAVRSGIYVYDQTYSPALGDSIQLTGTVDEFFNLTELKDISAFTVISSNNPLPTPIVLSTEGIVDEDYEGMLVQVVAAICTDPELGHGEWQLDDGSGPCAVDDLLFGFNPMLNTAYTVSGLLHYSFSAYKIVPRSAEDIEIALPLYFTRTPKETTISQNELTISWETNVTASTEVAYGLTPDLELGTLTGFSVGNEHEITITGLSPATIYYVQAFSTLEMDTTPTIVQVMSTASNSSGEIKVYFNHSVDHAVATNELAVSTDHIIDTIISYIDRAHQTLDVTMYEVENQEIVDAINAAYDRGVLVRYISDDEGNNSILDNLNPNIPLLKGNPEGIMHDKFLLIDRDDVDNCWVMTGSMNHTHNNLGWDYNNVICIQDQSLVKAYTLEFNEMWGGDGPQPNMANIKFGNQKTDNTPHCFNINNTPVALYFSPSDGTANKIKAAIDTAENEVAFAILAFTENSLGDAILDAHNRGLDVKGIIDYVEFNGSEFDYLVDNGVDVIDYQNADGSQWPDGPTLHHKYAIIDYATGNNPLVITGSHNWTASANSIHDENTLMIYDARLANLYYQEFNARFNNLVNPVTEAELLPLEIFPNPVENSLRLNLPESGVLQITNLTGQVVMEKKVVAGQMALDVSGLPNGLLVIRLNDYLGRVVKF